VILSRLLYESFGFTTCFWYFRLQPQYLTDFIPSLYKLCQFGVTNAYPSPNSFRLRR
jgi:hypothetical protein